MEDHLTTRQVAEALNVSESSVKRWCNSGIIPTVRTVGGHRRIPMADFLRYLEQNNRTVVAPLGLNSVAKARLGDQFDNREANHEIAGAMGGSATAPIGASHFNPDSEHGNQSSEEVQRQFEAALVGGEEAVCRALLTSWYTREGSFASLADDFIATTFRNFGELWDCGDLEVFRERRGCEICSRLLYEFRRLIPPSPHNAPLAIGGSPEGDFYNLPSQIVELVLQEASWKAMNLGTNLPLDTLLAAAVEHRPRMLWLSVSHLDDQDRFVQEFNQTMLKLPSDVMVVLGGRELTDELRPRLNYTGHCDNMQQLSTLAVALHGKRHSFGTSNN